MKFNKYVSLNDGFKRSVNIVHDSTDKNFIQRYILSPSNQQNLIQLAENVTAGQCAFSFTGPYGSGKSSFALYLSYLAKGKSANQEDFKQCIAKYTEDNKVVTQLFNHKRTRTILSLVGTPESPIEAIANFLQTEADSINILDKLEKLSKEDDGIIFFIDEMGKFLEKINSSNMSDIYFFQQLAELANRSNGRIIFIGIFHQNIAEYARSLSKATHDEWMKIQGRFIDLTINTVGEEQLGLIGKAIVSDKKTNSVNTITQSAIATIAKNKPINATAYQELLINCWPLHPIVSCLLGPVSHKKFGQNQRSIFSFLSSFEPYGFQYFLKHINYAKNTYYSTDLYWDYLKSNLENAILASNDSKKWVLANESIDKCLAHYPEDANVVSVLKLICLIDIFKGNSGLSASLDLLLHSFSNKEVESSLNKLKYISVIRETHKQGNFVLFEGSDFDIEDALDDALKQIVEIDFEKLNKLANFRPILAKRHYHTKGSIRWMDVHLIPVHLADSQEPPLNSNVFGAFIIVLPDNEENYQKALQQIKKSKSYNPDYPIVKGVTATYQELHKLSKELLALEWIEKNTPSLGGDRIARAEIESRKSLLVNRLTTELQNIMYSIEWFTNKNEGVFSEIQYTRFCSDLADKVFASTPIIHCEMLNRSKPSSNANSALNALLKAMVMNIDKPRLGINGFPAEGGLFKILLQDTGLYIEDNKGYYRFAEPTTNHSMLLDILWNKTDEFLKERNEVSLKKIYDFWSLPPFGIKKGLYAILLTAYILSKRGNIATYLKNTYFPEMDDLFIDYLIKSSNEITLKYVDYNSSKKSLINDVYEALTSNEVLRPIFSDLDPSPLGLSKKLVSFVYGLNGWVLRTRRLTSKTTKFRDVIKHAKDPNKLIFEDIVTIFNLDDLNGADKKSRVDDVINSLVEMYEAYPELLKKFNEILFDSLQINILKANLNELHLRAQNVLKASGDFRIDALASRLVNYKSIEEDIEDIAGIAGLAANKPIKDWIDLDSDRAMIEIAELCEGFKRAEIYSYVQGKPAKRHSIAFMSSLGNQDQIYQADFNILDEKLIDVEEVKQSLIAAISSEKTPEVVLTAIAELSINYIHQLKIKDE